MNEVKRRIGHTYSPGDSTFHPVVFPAAGGFILLFIAVVLIFSAEAGALLALLNKWVSHHAGWFLVSVVNFMLLACFILIFSRCGNKRLGGPEAKPDFSYTGWLAMLFSAGMGIGLVFWGVAEPVTHWNHPPTSKILPNSIEAARTAMAYSFFHWGLHAWGIYALTGLSMAWFAFNKGLPLTLRSTLYPILGERTRGFWGDAVDTLAAVSTLFGVATSLGFGVKQINSGLASVLGFPESSWVQVVLIGVITGVATCSVVMGLDRGVRRLSEINMVLATMLLVFVLLAGPTINLLNGLIQNIGEYTQRFITLSTWTETYTQSGWRESWTVFYWAWWIAWAPFVGMFIARISRGRTVREFLLGVLFVPTLLTFVWISIFGNSALLEGLNGNDSISSAVEGDVSTALFALLRELPWSGIASILGIGVILLFFVTSSDSASFVIDIITSGGHTNPPVWQKIFWAILEGAVAAVLLLIGGEASLKTLQTASVLTGVPFAVVLLWITVSLLRELVFSPDSEPERKESPALLESVG